MKLKIKSKLSTSHEKLLQMQNKQKTGLCNKPCLLVWLMSINKCLNSERSDCIAHLSDSFQFT